MRFRGWDRIRIVDDFGVARIAVAPLVISASRATDIPAFHAPWFLERLRRGYCRRVNPFNGKSSWISFTQARAVVFWTKNPAPLLPLLDDVESFLPATFFQYTLNDYEAEGLEPGVPPLAERIAICRRLADRVGPERLTWRFDPLLAAGYMDVPAMLDRVAGVGKALQGAVGRLVFSFAEIRRYAKVERSLTRGGVAFREWSPEEEGELARGLAELCACWRIPLAACAEEGDFSRFGVGRSRCVDGNLLAELFPGEPVLRVFREEPSPGLFGDDARERPNPFKDPGQRLLCGCTVSKDIGAYDTCPHFCRYCYANRSPESVARRLGTPADDALPSPCSGEAE